MDACIDPGMPNGKGKRVEQRFASIQTGDGKAVAVEIVPLVFNWGRLAGGWCGTPAAASTRQLKEMNRFKKAPARGAVHLAAPQRRHRASANRHQGNRIGADGSVHRHERQAVVERLRISNAVEGIAM
jgi:hypothetical protein